MTDRFRQQTLFDSDSEPNPKQTLFDSDSEPNPKQTLFDSDSEPNPIPPNLESSSLHDPAPITVKATDPPDSLDRKTVYVIDSHSLIYQVFHAIPAMSSPQGEQVGAVYGFTRDLFFLLERKRPDYLFCAFDLPGNTFRHEIYDQYKANRSPMPDDLVPQIVSIRRIIHAMGIPALGLERYEADDILATIARLSDELGAQCYLVTADKDCRQLITDRVSLYNIRKKQVMDRATLEDEWGIDAEQVVDFQALVGDPTDNVPGVPLIGPKIAKQLLQKYRTLDVLLDHAEEVAGKKRKQNLLECRDQAMLSRSLVRLDANVPIPIDWEGGRVTGIDHDAMHALCHHFGFHSLLQKVDTLQSRQLGSTARVEKLKPIEANYRLVDTPEAFEIFLVELKRQKCVSVDLETTSIWPRWAEIVGFAFAWKEEEAWYLPVRAPEGEPHLDPTHTLESLRPVIEDPEVAKIGQNLKYDMIVFRTAGVELRGLAFDTMVASYLLAAGERNHNLDALTRQYLGHSTTKISELIGSGKKQKQIDEVPVRAVADYAGEDALLPLRLRPILAKKLTESQLDPLLEEVELPLIDVLVELEFNGIKVDVDRLSELSDRYGERLEVLEKDIYELAEHPFKIGSTKQLQKVLFQELNLPVVKKTKTGPSTDTSVLEQLALLHPLPAKMIEYRQYTKLKSTYVDALPEMVHPQTGRVHASFNQGVAATGRLSSSDPNLQNIPVRTEVGREIRSAFIPQEKGHLLLAADYSQIELRVLAHFSGDQQLCEAFARDEDIHARVASKVSNVPLEEVTREMRRQAKAVNFGVIYGQTPWGLAKQLGISKKEAARFIDAYFAGYPEIEGFLNKILAKCRKNGYVETILGRRRSIQGVRPYVGRQRNLAERTAINTVIQGSAADLIKRAMIAVKHRLQREKLPVQILLQIHDELIFEIPSEILENVAVLVTQEMEGACPLDVPLKVDMKAGPNWADAVPW